MQFPYLFGWIWTTVDQHLCQLRGQSCSFTSHAASLVLKFDSIYQAVISFVIHLYIWLFLFHRNPVICRLSEGNSCVLRYMKNPIAWPLPCFVYVNSSYIQAVWDKLSGLLWLLKFGLGSLWPLLHKIVFYFLCDSCLPSCDLGQSAFQ